MSLPLRRQLRLLFDAPAIKHVRSASNRIVIRRNEVKKFGIYLYGTAGKWLIRDFSFEISFLTAAIDGIYISVKIISSKNNKIHTTSHYFSISSLLN